MDVLVLGDGLLGSEIIAQTGWDYLSIEKDGIDANDFDTIAYRIDDYDPAVVVNCIGHTDTYGKDRTPHWKINYEFVVNLVNFCDSRDIKIVQTCR